MLVCISRETAFGKAPSEGVMYKRRNFGISELLRWIVRNCTEMNNKVAVKNRIQKKKIKIEESRAY